IIITDKVVSVTNCSSKYSTRRKSNTCRNCRNCSVKYRVDESGHPIAHRRLKLSFHTLRERY
ncbi:hypothetical protein C0J52_20438, partial [Blattella germanica]